MYTVFDGGRPIINFNGDWDNDNNNNNFSATSTVVLDPAASGANWKKEIQVLIFSTGIVPAKIRVQTDLLWGT